MRVEGRCKEVAHGDTGVRCWGKMQAAGFGEEGEEGGTLEEVPNPEAPLRVMQGFG